MLLENVLRPEYSAVVMNIVYYNSGNMQNSGLVENKQLVVSWLEVRGTDLSFKEDFIIYGD
jgi:hypothetical protein